MSKQQLIVDASNLILGRMAAYIAKRALAGDQIVILNAERAVISGRKKNIVSEAKRRLETRTHASLRKSPVHPRRPDMYVRRVIRGMLPWRKPKGKAAFKRVRVCLGVPGEFTGKQATRVADAEASRLRCPYVTVGELAKEIGAWK